jgi:ubiquinone/menaquinone biosynthesis C-methylase UbiE
MHDSGLGIRYAGLDVSFQALKVALKKSPFIDYVCTVAEYSTFRDNVFDCLFCLGVWNIFQTR